jgi:phage protein D
MTARTRAQTHLRAFVALTELPADSSRQIVVEQDLAQPDMALVTLGGPAGLAFAARVRAGDDVQVVAEPASAAGAIFKGEIVGVEPVFEPLNPRVLIRAYNRIHRLNRERHTRVYNDVTDADLVAIVAQAHGLVPVVAAGLQERHEAVFQHNQTDLEFLRARAARLGFEVWCEDTKLFFARVGQGRPLTLAAMRARGDAALLRFHPRLASSDTIQEVVARGWDPVGKKEVVGTATAATLLLRAEPNTPGLRLGRTSEFTVDHPISSTEEAQAIAAEKLRDLLDVQGDAEAETGGHDGLRPGDLIVVRGTNDRFDGQYYVRGVSHRFTHHPDTCGAGYRTLLALEHRAPSLYFLPEIDDEVLLAFEQGDLARPYVVGSLWDDDDACSRDDPDRD